MVPRSIYLTRYALSHEKSTVSSIEHEKPVLCTGIGMPSDQTQSKTEKKKTKKEAGYSCHFDQELHGTTDCCRYRSRLMWIILASTTGSSLSCYLRHFAFIRPDSNREMTSTSADEFSSDFRIVLTEERICRETERLATKSSSSWSLTNKANGDRWRCVVE